METKITYVANDGKEFLNRELCLLHEKTIESKRIRDYERFSNEVFLFDENGNRLPLDEASFSDAYIFICKTEEAALFCTEEFFGYTLPWSCKNVYAGSWIFNNDEWIEVEEVFSKVELYKKIIEKYS